MRRVSRSVVAAVITIATVIGVSGVALAAEPSPTPTKTDTADGQPPISITADGNFYAMAVWNNVLIAIYDADGNGERWPDRVRNKADLVTNNGYVGGRDHVNIYWGSYYTGAYACIGPGTAWDLREHWQRFNWILDADYRGHMELVHDNAASHRWVYYCGNNTW